MRIFCATISLIYSIIILLCSACVHAQTSYLFIGSYNNEKSKTGIYIYKFDTANGSLTRVSAVQNVLNPAYLTLSPNGKYVYACTEARIPNGGTVSSYSFDADKGTLKFINEQRSEGENPVYLSVHKSGRWLVNANYTGGSVSVYHLGLNGNIEPASQVIAFHDSSINKERQENAHVHSAVFSPELDYVFFPDLGADKIRCFGFDTLRKEPLQIMEHPFTTTIPGSGPRHFTFHPNNRFCYCIEELSGTVTGYLFTNGKLDTIQRIAAHSKKVKRKFNSADIHISPDGLFLYASNRSKENNIAVFSIDQQTGKLRTVGCQFVGGDHPRNFVIDPSGKFVLVANQLSGNVVVFRRNFETGMLSKTDIEIKIPGASCLQIKNYAN